MNYLNELVERRSRGAPKDLKSLSWSLSWGGFFGLGRSWSTPKALLVDLGLVLVDLGSSWPLVGQFLMDLLDFWSVRACPGPEKL